MDHRIDEVETVGSLLGGDRISFMVHLSAGYQLDGAHTFGADSKREIAATMKRVRPCCCKECRATHPSHGSTLEGE